MAEQLSLLDIQSAYSGAGGELSNDELYQALVQRGDLAEAELTETVPIGKTKTPHNPVKRKIRWYQQTLKNWGY